MFNVLFSAVLKFFALPLLTFLILQPLLGAKYAFFVVTVTLTITSVITLAFRGIKLIQALMFFKGRRFLRLIISIFIQILSIITFWLVYLGYYNNL